MSIPLERFFRILVVGEHSGVVATVIEEELHFPVTSIDADQIPQAIRGGADLGAIIVARAEAQAVVDARDERGLRMPIFMISGRDDEALAEPFLK